MTPNPFTGTTDVLLMVSEKEAVTMEISDINGRAIVSVPYYDIPIGISHFRVTLSTAGTYVMTARQNGQTSSIKMINTGGGGKNTISLMEHADGKQIKASEKSAKGNVTHPWADGDDLMIEAVASLCETVYSQSLSMILFEDESITINFQGNVLCDGLPCPGAATVTDIDSNIYNTVQIGRQCWMKENLRVKHFANGENVPLGYTYSQTNPYRYVPNDDTSTISLYGYLYNVAAVMHGSGSSNSNPSGVQGICPNGWHVPSDAEWLQLKNYMGLQPQFHCDSNSNNIAKALSSSYGWSTNMNTCAVGNNLSQNNAAGFSVIPAGLYYTNGYYQFGQYADFWTATWYDDYMAFHYFLGYDIAHVGRSYWDIDSGSSVRCLRD